MEERLISVHQKVDELSKRFEDEKERVPKDMEARGQELLDMVSKFQKELSEERSDRLSREGRILKQMGDHSASITSLIERESQERERQAEELQCQITQNEVERSAKEEGLRNRIQGELSGLRDMIEREGRERKVEDDEIVRALNRYTQQLQSSLSVISS